MQLAYLPDTFVNLSVVRMFSEQDKTEVMLLKIDLMDSESK